MIIVKTEQNAEKELRVTRSDTFFIRKVGTDEIYFDACDLPEKGYTYEETDIPLPETEE